MNKAEIIRRAVEFREPDRIGFDFQGAPGSDFTSLWVPFPSTPWGRDPRLLSLRPDFRGEVMEDAFGNLWGRLDPRSKGEVLLGAVEASWDDADVWRPPVLPPQTASFLQERIAMHPERYRLASLPGFPFSLLRTLRGMENLLVDTALETGSLRLLGNRLRDFLLECVDAFHQAGADGVFVSEDWGTQQALFIHPDTWRTLFGPWIGQIVGAVRDKGMHMFFHSCGRIYEILPDLLSYGVQVLQLDQPSLESLPYLAGLVSGRACLYSSIDIQRIGDMGSRERVEAEAREMLRLFGHREGGLIARDYPDWAAIGVAPELPAAARAVFAREGGWRDRVSLKPPEAVPLDPAPAPAPKPAPGATTSEAPPAAVRREVRGLPFLLLPAAKGPARSLVPGTYPVDARFDTLLFLGMCTARPESSDTWGPHEPNGDYSRRLFVGDRLGRIDIQYEDGTKSLIPVFFGVNCWNHEFFDGLAEGEETLSTLQAIPAGPYREPFDGDPAARALLWRSLLLTEGGPTKDERYLFAVRPKPKRIARIVLIDESLKAAGWSVSAITGLRGLSADLRVPPVDEDFFVARRHVEAKDALARRLYQFDDALPDERGRIPGDLPDGPTRVVPETLREDKGFGAGVPRLLAEGRDGACLWGPVFAANLDDALENKVSDGCDIHTSSKGAAGFGRYQGMGCFKRGDDPYYTHIWTRDAARLLVEMAAAGALPVTRRIVEKLFVYLRPSRPGKPPLWQRIANAVECSAAGTLMKNYLHDQENDGHGLLMSAIGFLYRRGGIDDAWVRRFAPELRKAAEFFLWQMDEPEASGYDGLLYSESEPSAGGGVDVYSNTSAVQGLREFAVLFRRSGADKDFAERLDAAAATLEKGIAERFHVEDSRFGGIGSDMHMLFDGWCYGGKRFAPVFMEADRTGYDLHADQPDLFARYARTLDAMAEEYLNPQSGRMLGYGQGFMTQAVLLLDRYDLFDGFLRYAAGFCYHAHDVGWIVPEGVMVHPSGRFWFRNGDLGNSVQQAEILKVARLVAGVDDVDPWRGLRLVPRMADSYSSLQVDDLPVVFADGSGPSPDAPLRKGRLSYRYDRIPGGYRLSATPAPGARIASVRFGPFPSGSSPRVTLYRTGLLAADPRTPPLPEAPALRPIRDRIFLDVRLDADTPFELEVIAP